MNKTSLSLNPELPLRDSVTGLIHAELAGAETALTSGSPPTDEAVYAARKTIKRLRSIVRLARPALGKTQYRAWNTELRDLGRMLAGARDRAALVETAVDLASRVRGPDAPSQASRTRLVRLTQEHGSLMAGESHTAEAAAKAADIVADLRYQAIDWKKWTDHEVLRAGLATAHGRGVELLREAFATSDAETLHDARKRVVHLRYQLEALMPAWPKYLKSMMREYQTLREHLGDYNDLVNLEAAIGDPTSPLFRTPRRDDWLSYAATRRAQLIRRARNLADRLYAETTDAFTLRIVAYWEAGAREAVDHSVPDLVIDIDDDLDPAAVAAREDITSGS